MTNARAWLASVGLWAGERSYDGAARAWLAKSGHYLDAPPPGALFAVGVERLTTGLFGLVPSGALVGLAVIGRPVARSLPQDGSWGELTRFALDPSLPKGTASRVNEQHEQGDTTMGQPKKNKTKPTLSAHVQESAKIYIACVIEACKKAKVDDPIAVIVDTDLIAEDHPKLLEQDMIEFSIGWLHGVAEAHGLNVEDLWSELAPVKRSRAA